MSLTLERIEALAPDQSSLSAAGKLLKASGFFYLFYLAMIMS